MEQTDRVVTVAEAVRLTGLAERTIRYMLATGKLPTIRPAGLRVVRIPEQAVRDLLRADGPQAER